MKMVRSRYDAQPASVSIGVIVGDQALNTNASAAVGTTTGVLRKLLEGRQGEGRNSERPDRRATIRPSCSNQA